MMVLVIYKKTLIDIYLIILYQAIMEYKNKVLLLLVCQILVYFMHRKFIGYHSQVVLTIPLMY
ncbi:MAG: hypothetical protein EBS49_02975 [Verrucomicrobia bacterium]|nr:hypothetical protein [Verrucomicrobiota bacterium]